MTNDFKKEFSDLPPLVFSACNFNNVILLFNTLLVQPAAAKDAAPCIIFIDEFDSVGAKRTNSTEHPYANQTVNQLLNELDGFKQNKGIVVMGATNKVENLDK